MAVWVYGRKNPPTRPHPHTPTQHDKLKATLNFTDLCTGQKNIKGLFDILPDPLTLDDAPGAGSATWPYVEATIRVVMRRFAYEEIRLESASLGVQDSLADGGPYDRLAQEVGSKQPVPAVGIAAGLERLNLALAAQDVALPQPLDAFLVALGVCGGPSIRHSVCARPACTSAST